MARKSAYLRQRKAKNLRFLVLILLLIGGSFALYIYNSKAMDKEISEIESEIASNQKKLQGINQEITELKEDYNIRNTDEFKEKVAEDRLGMTKENRKDPREDRGASIENSDASTENGENSTENSGVSIENSDASTENREDSTENNDVSIENGEDFKEDSNDSKETIDNIKESSEESSEGSN